MKLGFTGTRRGMTAAQRHSLISELTWYRYRGHAQPTFDVEFHHGACRGADTEAASIAERLGCSIVSHPPSNMGSAALLARNRQIVAACELLLAAPEGPELLRSGTWATIRHARKTLRHTIILWPDGKTTSLRPPTGEV